MQAERYIAAADLGSAKIALSVAKVEGEDIQIIYYREVPSDGVRYSCVYNPGKAAAALRNVILDAEEQLHIKILQLVVGLPRYSIRQETGTAAIRRSDPGSNISKEEIANLKSMAIDSYELKDPVKEEIYGAVAQSFSADDELVCASENDVIGVSADTLEGNFNIFIGNQKPVSNIDRMLNDVGVAPAHKIFIPTAVAGAVLTEGERENGIALVEMGAGVTSVTIYRGNLIRHYASIPFGGRSITSDIKAECGFTERLAENIKLAYGACMPDKLQSLSEKIIQINDDENGSYEQLPVKYLSEIITCRAKEIANAILYLIQESGYADKLRNGIVLTGGGANLVNLANMIRDMSGYTVRLGFPRSQMFSSSGYAEARETGAAASIGMLLEAKKDTRLNCIEESEQEDAQPSVQDQEGRETAAEPEFDEEGNGKIFTDGDIPGEVITPSKKKGRHRDKDGEAPRITWRTKILNKIEDTVGELFDTMN